MADRAPSVDGEQLMMIHLDVGVADVDLLVRPWSPAASMGTFTTRAGDGTVRSTVVN
jgi:hypothetical protein